MASVTIQSTRPNSAALGAEQAVFTTSSWVHTAIFFASIGSLIALRTGSVSGWTWRAGISLGVYLIATTLFVVGLRASRLTCYDQGLVNNTLLGSATVIWDDVESIAFSRRQRRRNSWYAVTTHLVTLMTRDGTRLKFGDRFDDPFAIWTHLIAATGGRLLARAEREFAAGKMVDFGFVTFGRHHGLVLMPLWRSAVVIPLDELTNYDVKGGDVCFWRKGLVQPVAVPIDCVPNVFVLLNMLDSRTSNARAALLTVPEVYV